MPLPLPQPVQTHHSLKLVVWPEGGVDATMGGGKVVGGGGECKEGEELAGEESHRGTERGIVMGGVVENAPNGGSEDQ